MTSMPMLAALELRQLGDTSFEATPQPVPWPKAYGGDLVAAAMAAADRTVEPQRAVHSVHSYFLAPVEILEPVRYDVELLRDGRSYSQREIRARQAGKLVYIALASYHVREPGRELQAAMPSVPDPEGLPSSAEHLAGVDGDAARYWSHGRSFDIRHTSSPLSDDPAQHRLALAYACDYTILEPILRSHGYAWADAGLLTASLDHAMWFHRDGRLDDWVLYVQDAQSAGDGRGLARGLFFSRAGEHLATVMQEGMIRAAGAG
jgi:acyl-CoA thioesterase-2